MNSFLVIQRTEIKAAGHDMYNNELSILKEYFCVLVMFNAKAPVEVYAGINLFIYLAN